MAMITPYSVRASILSLGATTVDYAIGWIISEGSHPGPYRVELEVSKNGGDYESVYVNYSIGSATESATHLGAAYNATYRYRVNWYCDDCADTSAYGYSNTIAAYSDAATETLTMTDEVTEYGVYKDQLVSDSITMTDTVNQVFTENVSDTITMADAALSSSTLKTDYAYYLGDENGSVFTYSDLYGGFNGGAMESYIKFKKTDFSEVAPQAEGRKNSAYRAKLTYVDKGTQFVTFYWSMDGGVNWSSSGKTIGTAAAPGTTATAYYDFIASSEFFNWKLGCSSTSGTFKWVGLDIDFVLGGEAQP